MMMIMMNPRSYKIQSLFSTPHSLFLNIVIQVLNKWKVTLKMMRAMSQFLTKKKKDLYYALMIEIRIYHYA